MLIITGTQRTGTSLVASLFKESGYDIGSDFWDEEVNGGLENLDICAFYRYVLGDENFPFDDLRLEKKGSPTYRFRQLHLSHRVVKFSYLMMNPAFVAIWNRYRAPKLEDRFLVLYRPAGSVCRSKMRHWERFSHDSMLLDQSEGALTWNVSVSQLMLVSLGHTAVYLSYKDLTDPVNGLTKLNYCLKSLGSTTIDQEVWDEVFDENLGG